jgi:hypothetical protein
MYGDTGAAAHDRFGGVLLRRPSPDDAAPLSYGAKVLLWIGLAVGSWAAVILAGYFVWSAF